MNLNDLNTPFERHKIIHFAKDGNTVVHRSYEMQPIEGTLYKSRVEKDKWGELYHLFVVFPGIEQGLPVVRSLRVHNTYTTEEAKAWQKRSHLDSREEYLAYLDSAEAEDRHINLAEIEFVRQFDAQRADRYAAYRLARYARLEEKRIEERKRREAEDAQYVKEKNDRAEEQVKAAIDVIKNGCELENADITFYTARYSSSTYAIVNLLMRRYGIGVPLRTQGWINRKLTSVSIHDGSCTRVQYQRTGKARTGSNVFFQYMDDLIAAVCSHEEAA